MTFHVDAALLDRYAANALTDAAAASVEMHVTACASCRSLAARRTDDGASTRIKQALDERLDAVPVGRIEWMLLRAGMNDADARVMGAALALHGSWLVAWLLVLAFVVVAATSALERGALAAFLITAPLVPVAGVGVAYSRRTDPTYEIATAATLSGARIVLLRSLAVAGPAIPVVILLSVFLPVGALGFAWLLPAVGLAGAALALGTFVPLGHAATGIAVAWSVAAGVGLAATSGADRAEAFVRSFTAFRPAGQAMFAALAALAAAFVALRRDRFETAG